jgi:hypothetical protein
VFLFLLLFLFFCYLFGYFLGALLFFSGQTWTEGKRGAIYICSDEPPQRGHRTGSIEFRYDLERGHR